MKHLIIFGEQLRIWRERLGWSQQQLADWLQTRAEAGLVSDFRKSVDASTISKWERGLDNRRPSRAYMLYLIEGFKQVGLLLDTPSACRWAQDAGHQFTTAELNKIFPFSLTAPPIMTGPDITLSPLAQQRHAYQFNLNLLYEAIQEATRLGHRQQAMRLSIRYAKLYQQHGDYQTAITIYQHLINQPAEDTTAEYLIARAKNNLAYLYTETNQHWWPTAEDLCLAALATFQAMGAIEKLPHVYNQAGVLYTRQQRPYQAQDYLKKSLFLWEKEENELELISSFINLGLLSLETGQYQQALTYLNQGEQLAVALAKPRQQGTILMNLGIVYKRQQKFEQAAEMLQQAEQIFLQVGDMTSIAQCRNNLAVISLEQKQWEQADLYLQSANQLWQQLQTPYGQAIVEFNLKRWQKIRRSFIHTLATMKHIPNS